MAGPIGFFKGLGARVLYSMPATAICWSTYEFFKFILSNKSSDHYRSSVSSSNASSSSSASFQSKSLEKPRSPTPDDHSTNIRYVIPKPPVITTDIITDSNSTIHHSTASDLNLAGSQYIPGTSRELPSISGVGVYTAINMNERVYDTSIRGCSR